MGTGEENSSSKPSKSPSSTQETPAAPSYPDWSNSMQAYYGAGATTPPFFPSTVASPTPHPYMWGSQHPIISPYGTPVPYPAIYHPGGVYAHPGMTSTAGLVQTSMELEGKASEGKDQPAAKKSKGTSSTKGGRVGESGKAASGSGNDGPSQSAESGSDGSSESSDENPNQQESTVSKKGSFDQMLADGAAQSNPQAPVTGQPLAHTPPTNLNIGMGLWSAPSVSTGAATDERELKREKRKQSNRESARRSRLRKQAECEELQRRVEMLTNDNSTLREELKKLSEECDKLTSENSAIKEELTQLCGPDAVTEIEQSNPSTAHHHENGKRDN